MTDTRKGALLGAGTPAAFRRGYAARFYETRGCAALPLTLALMPNPSPGALHAPDADANNGSQVGSPTFPQIVSETLDQSLPVETTLRL